jgi:hypothetical protein
MRNRRTIAAVAAIALAASLALVVGVAAAQVNKDEEVDRALTGKVTAIDAGAKTLSLEEADGSKSTVAVTDKTTIMNEDAKVSFSSLHVGDWIALDIDQKQMGGKLVATYIEVVQDPRAGN